MLYPADGGGIDYAVGRAGVLYSYALELRGGGQMGFDPPKEDIHGIVRESWAGIKAMLKMGNPSKRRLLPNSNIRVYQGLNLFRHLLMAQIILLIILSLFEFPG